MRLRVVSPAATVPLVMHGNRNSKQYMAWYQVPHQLIVVTVVDVIRHAKSNACDMTLAGIDMSLACVSGSM